MTEHIDRDALREEALGAIEDGSYDGAGWAKRCLLLADALDRADLAQEQLLTRNRNLLTAFKSAEARIKAVRRELDRLEILALTSRSENASILGFAWNMAIRRALDKERL